MERKEERFKCVALTTVGGWISMIVAFLVGLYLASREKRTSACDGNLLFLCKELRDETRNLKILESFVRRRQPIVLRGTAESLLQNLDIEDYVPFDEIVTVMELENPRSSSNLFTYLQKHSTQTNSKSLRPLNASNINKVKLKGKEAWKRVSSGGKVVSSMSIPAPERTSRLFLRRLNDNVEIEEFDESTETTTRVWISSNSTTHTHFDESHNVFTQCTCGVRKSYLSLYHLLYHLTNIVGRGTKTFVLFPPESYSCLQLYPENHPAFRQARIAGIRTCPHFAVKLFPGDQLYIPPIWYHRPTSSNNVSISVNMWFRSAIQRLHDRVSSIGMPPFLSNVSTLTEFTLILMKKILSKDLDIATWIRDAILSRYTSCHLSPALTPHLGEEENDDRVVKFATRISIVVKKILRYDTDTGVRDVILADLLERYARHTLPESDVCSFFFQLYEANK